MAAVQNFYKYFYFLNLLTLFFHRRISSAASFYLHLTPLLKAFIYLFIYLFICLFIYLFIYLFVYLFI